MINFFKEKYRKLGVLLDRRRRARALKKINRLRRHVDPLGDIRQILYLDSIALRSLYVSRYGPEDARTTITHSQTKGHEIGSSTGLTVASPPSANWSTNYASNFNAQTTRSTQVELVASEQSLLRDFLVRESSAGAKGQIWDGTADNNGKFFTGDKTLERGNLIQVRIRLEADITYRISSFISAMTDLSGDAPQLQLPISTGDLEIAGLLQKFLINQAPINAEIIDWELDLTTNKLQRRKNNSRALRLVGLTQIDNYWVDVRSALFDRAECTALVRVSEDIPTRDWSPLKLFDAVKGLPGFDFLDEGINQLRAGISTVPNFDAGRFDGLKNVLTDYLVRFAPEKANSSTQLVETIASNYSRQLPSASALSEAFDRIEQLFDETPAEHSGDDLAIERSKCLAKHKLRVDGSTDGLASFTPSASNDFSGDESIAGEIIAIYW